MYKQRCADEKRRAGRECGVYVREVCDRSRHDERSFSSLSSLVVFFLLKCCSRCWMPTLGMPRIAFTRGRSLGAKTSNSNSGTTCPKNAVKRRDDTKTNRFPVNLMQLVVSNNFLRVKMDKDSKRMSCTGWSASTRQSLSWTARSLS